MSISSTEHTKINMKKAAGISLSTIAPDTATVGSVTNETARSGDACRRGRPGTSGFDNSNNAQSNGMHALKSAKLTSRSHGKVSGTSFCAAP